MVREGQVYLVESCKDCGDTETFISSDAAQYFRKRSLDRLFNYKGCLFECFSCEHPNQPETIFLDITNQCNLNCPICIANVSDMGFRYEPPMEYFEKIFRTKDVMRAHSQLHTVLRVIVLPFEDDANRESARLERCATAFTYVDPELDKVQTILVCAWGSAQEPNAGQGHGTL